MAVPAFYSMPASTDAEGLLIMSSAALVVVMGVSGSGKTTLGWALAERHGFRFVDADDVHPAENVAKMRAGIALDDANRGPWLARLAEMLRDSARRGEPTVLACSALKTNYRAILMEASSSILFVHLIGDRALMAARLATRANHYMSPSLLESQFATLEALSGDIAGLTLDCRRSVDDLCDAVMGHLETLGPQR